MTEIFLVLIVGLLLGFMLGALCGMNLTEDSEGNIRLRARARDPSPPTATLPIQAPMPLSGRLTISSGTPQLIQRTEVYRLDAEDEAGHVCRFCGLDLGQFDHTDCRRGVHGND
jgi:hypothetical protein